ncbi:MAG: Rab family GTPase [Candidatus Odinarchaeota archaeon]
MCDAILKTVILGEVDTGKTSLVRRFITSKFNSDCKSTIGIDFQTKDCELDNLELKLMIWDFAGQKRFRYMFPEYLYGALGGILMYDITNYSSFARIGTFLSLVQETNKSLPLLLVGSKLDLEDFREVPKKVGWRVAKSMGLNGFIECSSKTGENIDLVLETLMRLTLNNMLINETKIIEVESTH